LSRVRSDSFNSLDDIHQIFTFNSQVSLREPATRE
jgi:hypothetical protein